MVAGWWLAVWDCLLSRLLSSPIAMHIWREWRLEIMNCFFFEFQV